MHSKSQVSILLLLLASVTVSMAAKKRLSRDELASPLPIAQSADAPLTDNIATASDTDSAITVISTANSTAAVANDNTAVQDSSATITENDEEGADTETDAFQTMMDDCDPDMIGFEIITG